MVKIALDPMFAPVPYSDDRQITRTRRGINCLAEQYYDPTLVYCKCESCKYRWIMDKEIYITGYGQLNGRPNPMNTENIGIGGTGLWIGNFTNPKNNNELTYPTLPADITTYFNYNPINGKYFTTAYKQYTHLAHDTSYYKSTIVKSDNGYIHAYDFYPLTGGTGESGQLTSEVTDLYYDPQNGGLRGDKNSHYLGEPQSVYVSHSEDIIINNHPGGSGTYGGWYYNELDEFGKPILLFRSPLPRTFGGHPMACPNCGKVNFECLWLELHDRPKELVVQYKTPETIPCNPMPIAPLDSIDQLLGWLYLHKVIAKYYFTSASSSWYVEDKITFGQHVDIYVFDSNGNIIKPNKIEINHSIGSIRITFLNSTAGYFWALSPSTTLKGYENEILNACTSTIVRDFQRIKDDFI